jgi:hypothetical protein
MRLTRVLVMKISVCQATTPMHVIKTTLRIHYVTTTHADQGTFQLSTNSGAVHRGLWAVHAFGGCGLSTHSGAMGCPRIRGLWAAYASGAVLLEHMCPFIEDVFQLLIILSTHNTRSGGSTVTPCPPEKLTNIP